MSDTRTEPNDTRRVTGVELLFVFTLPALLLVVAIAAMAATGYWWLMGIAFVGELAATGFVARAIIHFTDDRPATVTADRSQQAMGRRQKSSRTGHRRHHRLALHH